MKKIFLPVFIIILVIIFFWYGYSLGQNKNKLPFVTNTNTKTSSPSNELAGDAPTDLYSFIKEKDFTQFAETVIEKRCPFYKPDGVTYRECLSDWEQSLESKLLTEQVDEVHAYCSTFTKKYVDETSIEGTELFLKCSIFKLQ